MTTTDDAVRTLGVDITIADVVPETDDAVSLVFDTSPHGARFDYAPGQFLTLRIPSDRTGSVARCYSLASSPAVDARPKVTVKRTRGGYASNWLCDNAEAGMSLRVLPPSGTFTAPGFGRDPILYAGGSGITPVMSMLKTALYTSDRSVSLFYANRSRAGIIFDRELSLLREEFADRLVIEHWVEDERGLPSAEALRAYAAPRSDGRSFVCGPAPFMAAVERALGAVGTPRDRIHVERFVSLTGDPFALAPLDASGSTETSSVTVTLDGEDHALRWPTESTLIDVLLAAGIDAPYSCREGECGSCTCLLTSGTVRAGDGTALSAEDRDDGYILACQATPTSSDLTVEF